MLPHFTHFSQASPPPNHPPLIHLLHELRTLTTNIDPTLSLRLCLSLPHSTETALPSDYLHLVLLLLTGIRLTHSIYGPSSSSRGNTNRYQNALLLRYSRRLLLLVLYYTLLSHVVLCTHILYSPQPGDTSN